MIVKMELEVAKESKEVYDLFVGICKDVRAKKPVSEILTDNVPKLFTAIEKCNEIPDEAKNRKVMMATGGYSMGEMVDALIGEKAPEAPAQA